MSPTSQMMDAAAKRNHWRTAVCDLTALLTIPSTLIALAYFHEFVLACHITLVMALLARTWLTPDIPKLLLADYVVLAIAAFSLLRFRFGGGDLGALRLAAVFTGILLYWALRAVRHRLIAVRWTLFTVGTLGALLAVYSILGSRAWIARVQAAGFQDVTALKGNLVSVLRGPINEWATVLVLLLILQAAAIQPVACHFLTRNALAIGAILPVSAALCLTFSRGAYTAAIAFAASVVLLALGLPRSRGFPRPRLILAVALVVSASALGANAISGGAVVRTARLHATEQQRRSSTGHFQVWASAVELASSHWLAGAGPGTFAMRYVPKAGLGEGRSFVGRPLNTGLALLVEEGIIGIALQALLAFAILVPAVRGSFRMSNVAACRVGVLAVGCGAFWIREMTFSSLLENPAVMGLYWVLLALLTLAASLPSKIPSRASKVNSRLALTVLSAASVLVFYTEERWKSADKAATVAAQAIQGGDANSAIGAVERAIAIRPAPYYLGMRALIRSLDCMPAFDPRQPFQAVQLPDQRSRLQDALHDLDQALAGNPDDDLFWHNRAWIRLYLGQRPEDVMPDMRRAVEIDGGTPTYRVSLGLLFERQGRTEEAREQYASALAAAPDICDSEFARDLKSRPDAMWDQAVSRAIRVLQARDPHDRDVSTRARLARLHLEQGRTEQARIALLTVNTAMPQYPRAWANMGRVSLKSGQLEQAEACLRKAAFLDDSDPAAFLLLASIARANDDQDAADSLNNRAQIVAKHRVSPHATRVDRVYKTNAVVGDDILPADLQKYCSPAGVKTN
jgi:tetratricopeptide (TPR) repeat protein